MVFISLVFISMVFISSLFAPTLLTAQTGQKSPTPVLPSAVLGSPLIVWSQAQKPAPLPVLPNLGKQPPPGVPRPVEPSSFSSPELPAPQAGEENDVQNGQENNQQNDDRLAKPPANSVPLTPIISSQQQARSQ